MLTNQQINDICKLSKDCICKRNLCETIEDAMQRVDKDYNQTIAIEIGPYKIQLTKEQKPIISILLQSIMATRIREMDENNKKITEIAGSGADSSEENVQTFTTIISSDSRTVKLEETDEEEEVTHFIGPIS